MEWQSIEEQIESATCSKFKLVKARPLVGGDINSAYCLQGIDQSYFVKLNRAETTEMFAAESAGLAELMSTCTVRVPNPVVQGVSENKAFLVLEYIELGTSNKISDRLLGHQLAGLHRKCQPYFGWQRDNTIGSTPQPNNHEQDWITFWRTQRLQHQLMLARKNGFQGQLQNQGAKLCERVSSFFPGYIPHPSLLHGDLWVGNAATDKQGNPVIFDPACYYGDREADIAMTELFGGFSQDFYAAYQDAYPTDQGYPTRKQLYNLYHILNHLNLFGSGYLRQAENLVSRILSEIN